MAVYREFFHGVQEIEASSGRIYNDACDYGAPTKKGDRLWNTMKQLAEMYGDTKTRIHEKYATGYTCQITITGVDEWAVADERKTMAEATAKLYLTFVSCKDGKCKGYDGYVYVEKAR